MVRNVLLLVKLMIEFTTLTLLDLASHATATQLETKSSNPFMAAFAFLVASQENYNVKTFQYS